MPAAVFKMSNIALCFFLDYISFSGYYEAYSTIKLLIDNYNLQIN